MPAAFVPAKAKLLAFICPEPEIVFAEERYLNPVNPEIVSASPVALHIFPSVLLFIVKLPPPPPAPALPDTGNWFMGPTSLLAFRIDTMKIRYNQHERSMGLL